MSTLQLSCPLTNESSLDRLIRLIAALVFYQLGFFWLGGAWQIGFFILGTVMLFTAVSGFCPLYRLLGVSTIQYGPVALSKVWLTISILGLAFLLVAGSYASDFFSRRLFLDDFNTMNNYYKQALFNTGQNDREKAIENYEQLVSTFTGFQAKYSTYQPYAVKGDAQFEADLSRVSGMIAAVEGEVRSGDLHQAHLALEEVRPVFQDILKRNDLSMLSVALVDFHDAMELSLDAAEAKEPQRIIELYPEVSAKLQVVEAEANDAEIQTIRQNLDHLLSLAQSGSTDELSTAAGDLKSSFIKVYLKRG